MSPAAAGARIPVANVLAAATVIAWSLLIGGSLAWNIFHVRQESMVLARNEATSNLNKDLTFRLWATSHGGVYVPVNAETAPNPYLAQVPERDVETTSGQRLTLMNPAYMLRQVQEQHAERFGVKGRITSLRPLNPINTPDAWETAALRRFERGEKEVSERSDIDGKPHLRMIRAMTVEQGCLKCHQQQGYRLGDVRGGIGVYVPLAPYLAAESGAIGVMRLTHGAIWLFGMGAIGLILRSSARRTAERERAERQAHMQQSLTALILDTLPINIFLKDGSGRFVLVNEETARTVGKPKASLIGTTDYDAFPPEVAERLRRDDDAVRAADSLAMREERLNGADGGRMMLAGKTMIRPEGAEFPLLLGFSLDITELKRVQERLNETLNELETILDNTVIGIALLKERRFVWVNPKTEEMTGYSREELAGQEPSFLYADPDDFAKVGREGYPVLAHGENYHIECRQRRKDGTEYWGLLSGKAIDPADLSKGSIWILEDVSGLRQAEEDLRQLNDTLEQRVRAEAAKNREKDHMLIHQSRLAAMGEMIGNIAHQWRQPLNALSLLLDNIQDAHAYNELDRAYMDESAAKGQQLIQKMSATIDDFRHFFTPNRAKTPFSLADSVRDAISVADAGFTNNHITIELRVERDATVQGFPNEYAQVVMNLLGNAKDAILERKIARGKVEIVVGRDRDNGYVTVRDNGGGIADEILDKIFDPYFTTREKGTGIGLYMSKMIIETNMDGRIEVRNTEHGAEFAIVTPLASGAPDALRTADPVR
ncbi:MAG: PAS domain S-box protein [Sulfuricella sp.]|nr:PAS domain S-box protein [Sulfuricella sp.]